MKKLIALTLALAFVLAAVAASASSMEEIIKRGELRVAVQTQCPPFSFVDKKGERTGSSVEFCKLMAEEMGVKIKFLDFDWDGLIPALLSGKADILAADMTANTKRAMKVSFTDPFYYTGTVAVVKKGSKFKSTAELNNPNVTIALLLGGTAEADVKRFLPKAKVKTYKGGGPIVLAAVKDGHADAAVNDESSVIGSIAELPPNTLTVLPGSFSKQPLSFAVRPEDTHLLQWINLFFKWTREDGRYDQNINYWVKTMDWKKDH